MFLLHTIYGSLKVYQSSNVCLMVEIYIDKQRNLVIYMNTSLCIHTALDIDILVCKKSMLKIFQADMRNIEVLPQRL